MLRVILTVGIQASGKSTWAKQQVKQDPTFKRVNRDLIREMLDGGTWTPENEKFVLKIRDLLIIECLKNGNNVICDDMNLHPSNFDQICDLVKNLNLDCVVTEKHFTVDLEEAIKRDSLREYSVGERVIRNTWEKYNVKSEPNYKERTEVFLGNNASKTLPFEEENN